jgi:DNA-binding response OmpR family regulator
MTVLVAVRDLLLRSRITETAERAGVRVRVAPRGVPLSQAVRELGPTAAVVDLAEPGVLDELRRVRTESGVHVIGFLGHLEVSLAAAATAAGAHEVLSRGQLVARLEAVLRSVAGEAAPPPGR